MLPTLSKIRIYPIKSLDPVELTTATIGIRSLSGDRRFAMLGDDGKFVNGKRTGLVNLLQTGYNEDLTHVTFSKRDSGESETFDLNKDVKAMEKFLSGFFNFKINLLQNEEGRLLDVPDDSAVTVVATETLQLLSDELNDPVDTLRLRFRTNLEISNVPPYWEEHLASLNANSGIRFKIGDVEMTGISLRARCNVPPRNPFTGETDKTFIKRMMASRNETVPLWSHVNELGSLYHLTVDTFIPDSETGKQINIGDTVEMM